MPRVTKADLEKKLEQANKIIEQQITEMQEIRKEYEDLISKNEYDNLLNQYQALEKNFKSLEYLHNAKNSKNSRGAGRKTKINDELISGVHKLKNEGLSISAISNQLNISVGLVHKVTQIIKNKV